MEVVEEWEGEEESGGLKVRSRKGKMENPEAEKGAVQVEELGDSESCVYLDKDKGLWKCRHCVWTYQLESPGIDHFQNHEDCSNQLMTAITSSQQGSCFGLQSKGIESAYEITETKFCSVRLFIDEEELGNDGADFETKTLETQNDLPFIGDHGSPKQMKDENESNSSMVFSERQCEDGTAKFEPIKDKSGTNATGSLVDAGKIAVEMDVERVLEEQETHDLFCPNCNSCITKRVILRKRKWIVADLEVDAAEWEEIQPLLPPGVEASPDAFAANDPRNETGTDVFRCLSCFSLFIRNVTGFKLFPNFRRSDDSESSQSPQQTPAKDLNCISSFSELFVGELTGNEPDERNVHLSINSNDQLQEELHPRPGKQMEDPKPKPVEDENNLIASKPNALMIGESKINMDEISEEVPDNDFAVALEGLITSGTPVLSQDEESVPTVETGIVMPKEIVDDAATRKWDILKSIVYGGLAESIASLGVVSSAAGSDATTLNIVALGVANLITGLLVIIHNLRELKNEQHSSVDQDGERLDRYQATLGRREKFWLHATVSVSSYILFGLLPPVIYGFSFRKSDNREYKLIAVAAASLLCIILLAAGKAHVRKAPKNYIRTILYHVGIGVTASGLSYAVGVLFEKLLEKLGWLDSGAAAPVSSNLAFPEMVATESRWASY